MCVTQMQCRSSSRKKHQKIKKTEKQKNKKTMTGLPPNLLRGVVLEIAMATYVPCNEEKYATVVCYPQNKVHLDDSKHNVG